MNPASARMIRLMKHMRSRPLTLKQVRVADQRTLIAVLDRGWAVRRGMFVELSASGDDALADYTTAEFLTRKHEGNPSDSVARILHLVRRFRK